LTAGKSTAGRVFAKDRQESKATLPVLGMFTRIQAPKRRRIDTLALHFIE
jgi:hypothetical protein